MISLNKNENVIVGGFYFWTLLIFVIVSVVAATGCFSNISDSKAESELTIEDNTDKGSMDESNSGLDNEEDGSSDAAPVWTVTEITTIKEYGKSVDWLHSSNLVVTARPLHDGYYDLLIFNMDNPDKETYLTHDAIGVPQKHNGNPAWHPSGEYIVFTAENADVEGEQADFVAIPGKGVNCNLWLARADGAEFWQLTYHTTAYDDNATGVLHPQFSSDGQELFWSERVGGAQGTMWGQWELKVASFFGGDEPHFENIRTFTPRDQSVFYESHAFSHDGKSILFSGNLEMGQTETGLDIYEMDLKTGGLTPLTSTFSDWDEHAHWSPDGQKIAWMSSTPLDIQYPPNMGSHEWPNYLATEFWLMDADGSNKQRLTFFNEEGHPHQRAERTIVSDSAWAIDGKSLVVLIANVDVNGNMRSELVLLTLGESN